MINDAEKTLPTHFKSEKWKVFMNFFPSGIKVVWEHMSLHSLDGSLFGFNFSFLL